MDDSKVQVVPDGCLQPASAFSFSCCLSAVTAIGRGDFSIPVVRVLTQQVDAGLVVIGDMGPSMVASEVPNYARMEDLCEALVDCLQPAVNTDEIESLGMMIPRPLILLLLQLLEKAIAEVRSRI